MRWRFSGRQLHAGRTEQMTRTATASMITATARPMTAMSARARAAVSGPARQRAAPHALAVQWWTAARRAHRAPKSAATVSMMTATAQPMKAVKNWYGDADADTYGDAAVTCLGRVQPDGLCSKQHGLRRHQCQSSNPARLRIPEWNR